MRIFSADAHVTKHKIQMNQFIISFGDTVPNLPLLVEKPWRLVLLWLSANFQWEQLLKIFLCQVLGIVGGTYLEQFSNEKDILRIRRAQKADTEKAKRRRKELKFKKVVKDDKKQRTEGVTYSAGSFNT